MKKILLSLLLLSQAGFLFAQQQTYTLTGKIGNYNKPAMIFLSLTTTPYDHPFETVDSALLVDGHFKFTGKTTTGARRAFLSLERRQPGTNSRIWDVYEDYFVFYLEPGTTKFSTKDSMKLAVTKGSKATSEYVELQRRIKIAQDAVATRREAQRDIWKKATPAERLATEFHNSYLAENSSISKVMRMPLLHFIQERPTSLINLDMLMIYGGGTPDPVELIPLFKTLAPALQTSTSGKDYAQRLKILSEMAIGNKAPLFSLPDTSGKMISLADYKGRYVLLEFWASWCGGCRSESPHLINAYNKYKNKGFDILGISLDIKKYEKAWIKAIKDDKLLWPQVADLEAENGWNNQVAKLYQVEAVPQNYLIDPEGKIIGIFLRGESLDKKLVEVFGEVK